MLDHLTIETGSLLANTEQRTVEGLLLPFDELGSTSAGRVRIAPDAVPDPDDLSVLAVNVDHDQLQPVARFAYLQRAAAGLFAGFKIGKGAAGDALLAAIADPANTDAPRKLSVELRDIVRRGDVVVAGVLTGAAFCKAGAFPSAGLLASLVVPEGDDPTDPPAGDQTTPAGAGQPAQIAQQPAVDVSTLPAPAAAPAAQVAQPVTIVDAAGVAHTGQPIDPTTDPTTDPEDDPMDPITTATPATAPATAPAGLHASHPGAAAAAPQLTARHLFAALAAARETRSSAPLQPFLEDGHAAGVLFAALQDVKAGTIAPVASQPAWLGELWELRTVRRRIVPLLAHKPLTGMKAAGFRWTERPKMGRWAANKTAVPSNPVSVTPYEVEAQPFAGAHDVDIRFKHFTVPGFWESYWASMSDSYAIETDAYAFEQLAAAATDLEAAAVPTDVAAGLSYIVDGALQMIDDALPTFAIVAKDLWRDIVLTKSDDQLAFLSSALKLDGGDVAGFQIVPAALPAGQVIVGHQNAMQFHELDGVPIRVEGLDVVKGGVDPAAFGYAAAVVHDPAGIVRVQAPAVTP